MASKKDLLEAQNFSKARLLSAFVGGAPGGKELEPAKPLRAVFAGIALTAMVVLAGVFIGLIQPKLPGGWENNRLIVASDTGARYISVDGTLHPVINTVSARMAIPAGEFKVVTVKQGALEGIPIGGTLGILGAPDTLPEAEHLDGSGWAACATPDSTRVQLGGDRPDAAPTDSGVVVTSEGGTYVITGGTSYAVAESDRTAVLRAIGLDGAAPAEVGSEWLALFTQGADLRPIGAVDGGTVRGVDLPAGSVIRPTGGGDDERYLLTGDGSLARLSDLAYRLYLLGGGSGALGDEVEVSPAQIAALATADPAGPADWPQRPLTSAASAAGPCATLTGAPSDQQTVLAAPGSAVTSATDETTESDAAGSGTVRVSVAADGGALVRGGSAGPLTLIDASGTAYAVPGDVATGVTRLGYADTDVAVVPATWIQLLTAGPALTAEAASASPEAS
ncbi:type VII secretion protein EccB [Leucobacter japonicus]|uniref:type VII secretion protein EccB n=1 Tax=Leucobacter japonicus TaxID=1461259 RepID=UPI0006A7B17F|nr:type VII secretion protein EccB [Leucobacter japonicus]